MPEEKKKGGQSATAMASAMVQPGLINKDDIPQVLPILPLRNSVFFPGGVLPLAVGRQKTIALIKDAVRDDQVIGVVTQRKAEEEDPGADDIHKLSSKIDSQVKGEMSKTQREYYLRQQLKAIKEELGELGEEEEELDELGERLKKIGLPPEVEKVANKELNRLKSIPTASSEYTVARTYLEWIADLPWSKKTEDNLDVENAREVLHKDHYSLEKVKKRILEYLAVRKLKNAMKGPILCLVGPPGVGKTSLGQSIARATNRTFVRLSLGGVRDEAEIRGHRRTYVGALPGRVIQSMKKAATIN